MSKDDQKLGMDGTVVLTAKWSLIFDLSEHQIWTWGLSHWSINICVISITCRAHCESQHTDSPSYASANWNQTTDVLRGGFFFFPFSGLVLLYLHASQKPNDFYLLRMVLVKCMESVLFILTEKKKKSYTLEGFRELNTVMSNLEIYTVAGNTYLSYSCVMPSR